MLAILKGQSVFGIPTGGDRLFSLLRPLMLGNNTFTEGGQGPEKPIIEELDIEEEIFTFPYPEERGEISDIINPPLNGIVGKVLYAKGKANSYLTIRAGFSNVFSYLFFDSSLERPTRTAKPEFVSLTRQPEIVDSYRDLLIYSSYIASNANFSYTSNNSNNVYYEYSFPMPMISRMVYYDAKENDKVYVQSLMQVKLQHYQNVPHKETHVQLVNTQLIDITSNNNVPDLNFRLNLKLDYKAPKLELPLVKSELPVLDLNIESDENKTVILSLYKLSHNVRDLVVPVTLPRLNTVVVPKYDEARVKYEAMKNIVTLPLNLGFDDTLLRDGFIERLKQVSDVQVRDDLRYKHGDSTKRQHEIELRQYIREREFIPKPNHQAIQLDFRLEEVQPQQITDISDLYGTRPLNFSLDNQPVAYNKARVNLDPCGLFSLGDSETQTNYHANLDNLVRVNYDTNVQSLPGITTNSYSLDFIDSRLQVQLRQATENTSVANSDSGGIASKQRLEGIVEQEVELTEEEQNVQAEVYDENKADAQEDIYEKSEIDEKQETETNESGSSSYAAVAAGVVGLGVLAGLGGIMGALLKKDDNEETAPNKPNEALYKSEEGRVKENCGNTSHCFADTIKWLEGRLRNPTLTDEEYESISQCYAEEIKNIQKAREYIKKRERGYSCSGDLYNLFHHIDFTEEQEKKYKLRDYIRKGEVQKGFKLTTTIIVGEELKGNYDIEAIWVDDEKGGQLERVALKKSSAYAQLDIGLREQGYTPIWKMMSYIDTETGEKRNGLYLETIVELHLEAKKLLGDRDEFGMKLMGIILLINGQEPGRGCVPMHNYGVKPDDRIEVVFKNDSARYEDNRQPTLDEKIEIGFDNYSETKKSHKEVLEPALF